MKKGKTAFVILAAGLGTRMKSDRPKVLHRIFDRPMLSYVLDTAGALKSGRTIVVVGELLKDISNHMELPAEVEIAIQKKQNGTADALKSALPALKGFKGTVIVTNGDTPLITPATLRKFIANHTRAGNALSMLSFDVSDPTGYGRILRGPKGLPLAVVEEKDASRDEKLIREVNSGVYAIETSALPLLESIKENAKKSEFYLTDIIALALEDGVKTGVYNIGDEDEFIGVNSRKDLEVAHETMRANIVDALADKGVTFIDSFTAHIGPEVKVGRDTIIYPNVFVHGKTVIGKGCTIYPNTRIVDSTIKDGAVIKDSTLIEESLVGKDAQVGPMAHLRPGATIGIDARIGNFVEVKKSTIGSGTKAMHLSYIGDSTVGKNANLGAGTITCNYDGKRKFSTTIGDRVFIGSDTQLIAPVTVGSDAYVGAGSTITRDVEPGSLAVSRAKQKNLKRYTPKKRS